MKSNIKIIAFIIFCAILLYFTKVKYNDHSLNKSILACVIAQTRASNTPDIEKAKIFCEEKIKKQRKIK